MVQTPQQRRANEAFARRAETKMGRPVQAQSGKKTAVAKSPVSKIWLLLLVFVVCGGLIFELMRILFGY